MRITPELAEICGIHAGDGYLRNKDSKWEWDVSGGLDEIEYYNNRISHLVKTTFGIDLILRSFPSRHTYGFVVRDKRVIQLLHSLGFEYGAKTYSVRVPQVIRECENRDVTRAFLRGLFDTDGCIHFGRGYANYVQFKKTHHVFPRVLLTTVSESLSKDVAEMVESLGFRFFTYSNKSKNSNEAMSYRLCLQNSNAVRWMRDVGSFNPSKSSRFEVWERFGFCPPCTTYEQRKQMLNNELDPNSFYGPVA